MKKLLSKTILLAVLGWSPTAPAEDLLAVYKLAQENDAELLIAESDYLAAIQAVPFARSANRPQISFNANASASEVDNDDTGSSSENNSGYSLNVTQSLYDNVVDGNISAAEATSAAQLARVQAARQSLVLRVAQAYFRVLGAHDNVDFTLSERKSIARQLEQAEKRFEVGLIAITDVHEAQARFDTSDAQAILAENILENTYQALAVITGVDNIRNLSKLRDDIKLEIPEPAGSDAWVKLALEYNRDLLAAQQNLNAARFEREKNARRGYPTLDLFARYADSDYNTDNDFRDDSGQEDLTVGLELEIPIYTGGRISSEQARSESEYSSAQNQVLLQNRLATQQARVAYLDVVSGISSVRAFKQALASTEIALEATQAGFDVGTRTSVDVLIAVRETFRAQLEYAAARYEFVLNSLRLRQAAGILQEDNLAAINRWLVKQ